MLCANTHHFGLSSKLQEMVCLLAQGYVFKEAEELLGETLGIELSAKQIQRVSEHYGAALEQHLQAQAEGKAAVPLLALKKEQDVVDAMVDGSLIFSREEGWKEIKVGRLFSAASCVAVQATRRQVMQSLYVCHVGGQRMFLQKFEACCAPYANKVFIADGAKWIWNWVEDAYPAAVQILDFYHALEKLGAYAGLQYADPSWRSQWLETQKQALLSSGVDPLLQELKAAVPLGQEARKAHAALIRYYEDNQSRMQYHRYLAEGLMIGSGAVESAHRNVVQQRLKLSGQRWSIKGAQQIANLRACKKSKQWDTLSELIKTAA